MLEDIYSKTSAAEVQWWKSASQVEGGTKHFPLVFVLFVLLATLLLIRFSDSIGRGARKLPNPEVTFSITKQTDLGALISASPYIGPAERDARNVYGPWLHSAS
jgi:hypothetical protein